MTTALLGQVLVDARHVTVVDVETTGFSNDDRVIEVAVVTLDRDGRTVDEFETLIDPGRGPGPTRVHRITDDMLRGAPRFDEVVAHLAARLDGNVFCAHNVPFDRRMLDNEFARCRVDVDWGTGVDTLRLTGAKLSVACSEAGITIPQAHRALHDARATASLLCSVADGITTTHAPVTAGVGPTAPLRLRTRDGFATVPPPG